MRGPIAYLGGKSRLAPEIISKIPQHTAYIEPFCGGAQVFFRKPPSPVEVINDLDHEVVTFYRVCQLHHDELIRYLRFTITSRECFEIQLRTDPTTLTDIQRAARFLYLQKNAYAGLILHKNYRYSVVIPPSYNPLSIPDDIARVHERLARVQIECLPYETVLDKYDRPESFFYCDPPYFRRPLYRSNLAEGDYKTMSKRLSTLKGKFLLSINDAPEMRATFGQFRIEAVSVAYSAQRKSGVRFSELLISNY